MAVLEIGSEFELRKSGPEEQILSDELRPFLAERYRNWFSKAGTLRQKATFGGYGVRSKSTCKLGENSSIIVYVSNGENENWFWTYRKNLKGGPEPLEKEINEISGSKREDRLLDPFFEVVQNSTLVRFSYLLRLCNFCKAPRDMRKFPQKCQKIAGCWESTV